MAYFLVFIGGGLGSMCRFGIAQWMQMQEEIFPWATLIANMISCLILGALLGLSIRGEMTMPYKLMLMTGFCGGFSTFSTFSSETFQLLQSGEVTYAFANVGLSLVIGLVCIYIGLLTTMES